MSSVGRIIRSRPLRVLLCAVMLLIVDVSMLWDGQVLASQAAEGGTPVMTPHFVLDEEKLRALRASVQSLSIGDSRGKVIEVVGPPSREEFVGPKQARDWTHRYLIYDVKIIADRPGNVYDEEVALIFDREDRLLRIRSNVEGITTRGTLR